MDTTLNKILLKEDIRKYFQQKAELYSKYIDDDSDTPIDTFQLTDADTWLNHPCYLALNKAKQFLKSYKIIDMVYEKLASTDLNYNVELAELIEYAIKDIRSEDVSFLCLENRKVRATIILDIQEQPYIITYLIDKNGHINYFDIELNYIEQKSRERSINKLIEAKSEQFDLSKIKDYLARSKYKTFLIKNWTNRSIIYETEPAASLKKAVEQAVREKVNLRFADLQGANLAKADLRGANLRRAYLRNADLHGASLQGADLQGAYLHGANLYEVCLREADLREADLRGADLRGADLRGADLHGANLQYAYLYGANLYGADLRVANLEGADLKGAKFSLSKAQLARTTRNFKYAYNIDDTTQFSVPLNESKEIDLDDIEWGYYEEPDKDKIEKILRDIPRNELEKILDKAVWKIYEHNEYTYDNTIDFLAYMLSHNNDEAIEYARDILRWPHWDMLSYHMYVWRKNLEKYIT